MLAAASEMEDQRAAIGIAPLENRPEPAVRFRAAQKAARFEVSREPLIH